MPCTRTEFSFLVFRGQCHLTPRDEVRALPSKLFSHQPEDNDENQDQQSYTGGAGTQHRLPQYPSVALVGKLHLYRYRVNNFFGLTAELHPEDARVNHRLFGTYEVAREGTHLLSARGSKGQTDPADEVNLSVSTSVPLVIRERHSGKTSLVASYHVASISSLADGPGGPPRLDFEDANQYMAVVWGPGLVEDNIYRHRRRLGDHVAWSNRLFIHTATSTSAYAGEERLHTCIPISCTLHITSAYFLDS